MASPSATGALTDLLGDTRARILTAVQAGGATAPDLACELGISAAAVRRHLGAMQSDGLVDSAPVHDGGTGRPAERWTLTQRGKRLFTDREGGVEHVGADNMSFGRDYIADWFAETLGGKTR